jgi:hypothetical protein
LKELTEVPDEKRGRQFNEPVLIGSIKTKQVRLRGKTIIRNNFLVGEKTKRSIETFVQVRGVKSGKDGGVRET